MPSVTNHLRHQLLSLVHCILLSLTHQKTFSVSRKTALIWMLTNANFNRMILCFGFLFIKMNKSCNLKYSRS